MGRVRHEIASHLAEADAFGYIPQEQQLLVGPVRHDPAIQPAAVGDRGRNFDAVVLALRVQQPGQCRVTQDVIHSLAAVLLALQSGKLLGRPVARNDLVILVENDGAVGHRVRRFANLAHELSVAALVTRGFVVFIAKA